VEGKQEESTDVGEFVHKGLAQRSFERHWTLAEDTEVRSVSFNDGLLVVELGRIVPDHHSRKEFL
jgi:molecular chaperone IbpA